MNYDMTHFGERGDLPKGDYSISLFGKMGDKEGERGQKCQKNS